MNSLKAVSSLVLCAGIGVVAGAAEDGSSSIEERLQRIEAQLARLESQLGDKVETSELAPTLKEFSDLSKKLGWDGKSALNFVKPAGKEKSLSLGGFVQLQGEFGDAPDSRFTGMADRFLLRRARLTVKSTFQENFELLLQTDFGNISIGNVSGARGQLTDAYVAWTKYSWANLQIGQFKTPFGYEQLMSDTKALFAERSLPNDMLTVSRQIGMGASGTVLDKKLTYSVGVFNGTGVNNGNNDNDQFMTAGRVAGEVWSKDSRKVTVGVNGYWSKDNGTPIVGTRNGLGVDLQYASDRWNVAGEYLTRKYNRVTGADTESNGWYVWAGYYFVPKLWQAVLRYESYDSDIDAANTTSDGWVAGLNYYLKGDDIKLSLNYHYGDPAGIAGEQGRLTSRVQVMF